VAKGNESRLRTEACVELSYEEPNGDSLSLSFTDLTNMNCTYSKMRTWNRAMSWSREPRLSHPLTSGRRRLFGENTKGLIVRLPSDKALLELSKIMMIPRELHRRSSPPTDLTDDLCSPPTAEAAERASSGPWR